MFRAPRVDKKMKSSPFRPNAYRRLACEEEEEGEEYFSHKYIQPYPTTSSSTLFSTLQLLPAWPPASAEKNQRKLHCRPQRQCNELREVHHRDPKQYLEDQRLLPRQSSRSLPGFLCQIWKRTNKNARLDRNAGRKQRTDQTKLNEHRLSLQTLQPGARSWAQRSAKTRRVNFCWHRRSCAQIRCLSIFINK